jgi:hypothetical protein
MLEYIVVGSILVAGSLFALFVGLESLAEEMERKREQRERAIRRRVAR